jgi:hypothetical protein
MNAAKQTEFKQVYQVGFEKLNSFGDQTFKLFEDGLLITYIMPEGNHVNIEQFADERRAALNQGARK